MMRPELGTLRARIDTLDAELVDLLARRAAASKEAMDLKAASGQPVFDAAREAEMIAALRVKARAVQLDEERVEKVFRAVLELSRGER
jgi:chorismate mutase